MQQWLKTKSVVKNISNNHCIVYTLKQIECEICKAILPDYLKSENNTYDIWEFLKPTFKNYLIMETVNENPNNPNSKTLYMLNFDEKVSLNLGRSNSSDIKITDVSVSRIHCFFKLEENGCISLKDNKSKFGTLVLLNHPFIPIYYRMNLPLQIGRSLLKIKLKIPFCLLRIFTCWKTNEKPMDYSSLNSEFILKESKMNVKISHIKESQVSKKSFPIHFNNDIWAANPNGINISKSIGIDNLNNNSNSKKNHEIINNSINTINSKAIVNNHNFNESNKNNEINNGNIEMIDILKSESNKNDILQNTNYKRNINLINKKDSLSINNNNINLISLYNLEAKNANTNYKIFEDTNFVNNFRTQNINTINSIFPSVTNFNNNIIDNTNLNSKNFSYINNSSNKILVNKLKKMSLSYKCQTPTITNFVQEKENETEFKYECNTSHDQIQFEAEEENVVKLPAINGNLINLNGINNYYNCSNKINLNKSNSKNTNSNLFKKFSLSNTSNIQEKINVSPIQKYNLSPINLIELNTDFNPSLNIDCERMKDITNLQLYQNLILRSNSNTKINLRKSNRNFSSEIKSLNCFPKNNKKYFFENNYMDMNNCDNTIRKKVSKINNYLEEEKNLKNEEIGNLNTKNEVFSTIIDKRYKKCFSQSQRKMSKDKSPKKIFNKLYNEDQMNIFYKNQINDKEYNIMNKFNKPEENGI